MSQRRLIGLVLILALMTACDDGDCPTPTSPLNPLATTDTDWQSVATMLGRTGTLSADGFVYRTAFPRRDFNVTSYGVTVAPGMSFGSFAAFVRHDDGTAMAMGDLVVLETELQ